ncbi:MAG: hypothetical protein U0Q16_18795 [Bryobacteraceae bacterium]
MRTWWFIAAVCVSCFAQDLGPPRIVVPLIDGKLEANQIVLDPWPERKENPKPATVVTRKSSDWIDDCWFLDSAPPPPRSRVIHRKHFENANVATLAGAPVRRIVVKKFTMSIVRHEREWPVAQKELETVWASKFREASAVIAWAEGNFWDIFAILEFEGTEQRGCLVTDGSHVHIRDVNGDRWYTRLEPTPAR